MIDSLNLPSPIISLAALSTKAQVELYIKRDDLIHPSYGGNKWRKLKYNLQAFRAGEYTELITFGGAFSNHIAATAAVTKSEGIPSVGIIRGNYSDADNPTLKEAKVQGMQLFHVSKEAYRHKEQAAEVQEILSQFDKPLLIPEGGSNALALTGVGELMDEVHASNKSYDHIILAAGTGTTAAGLIAKATAEKITVINVLKNPELEATIASKLTTPQPNWQVNNDYHFGGFAKTTDELITFINDFCTTHAIPLDPIYNGKGMYATLDLISKGYFPQGSRILYIHTGGQQGITAYNYRTKLAKGKGRKIIV